MFGVEVSTFNKSVWSYVMIYHLTENYIFIELEDQEDSAEKVSLLTLSQPKMSESLEILNNIILLKLMKCQ
jgi:hypothetical protein